MEPSQLFAGGLISPRRFRLAEYHALIAAGVLGEDDHVELLEGVIVEMTPQKRPHALFISRLSERLFEARPAALRVRVQLPLTLDDGSEPEPDLAVVSRQEEEAAESHPRTALLVVEVADASLRKDRVVKGRLYARAGIPEYWIADLERRAVEVHSEPDAEAGLYRSLRTLGAGDTLTSATLPGLSVPLDPLFL